MDKYPDSYPYDPYFDRPGYGRMYTPIEAPDDVRAIRVEFDNPDIDLSAIHASSRLAPIYVDIARPDDSHILDEDKASLVTLSWLGDLGIEEVALLMQRVASASRQYARWDNQDDILGGILGHGDNNIPQPAYGGSTVISTGLNSPFSYFRWQGGPGRHSRGTFSMKYEDVLNSQMARDLIKQTVPNEEVFNYLTSLSRFEELRQHYT